MEVPVRDLFVVVHYLIGFVFVGVAEVQNYLKKKNEINNNRKYPIPLILWLQRRKCQTYGRRKARSQQHYRDKTFPSHGICVVWVHNKKLLINLPLRRRQPHKYQIMILLLITVRVIRAAVLVWFNSFLTRISLQRVLLIFVFSIMAMPIPVSMPILLLYLLLVLFIDQVLARLNWHWIMSGHHFLLTLRLNFCL